MIGNRNHKVLNDYAIHSLIEMELILLHSHSLLYFLTFNDLVVHIQLIIFKVVYIDDLIILIHECKCQIIQSILNIHKFKYLEVLFIHSLHFQFIDSSIR